MAAAIFSHSYSVLTRALFSVSQSSTFEYILMLYADKLGMLVHSKFHVWDLMSPVDDWKILLISLAKYAISGQSDMETDLPDTGSLGFGFNLIILVFWKSMQILFTDRALLTIKCIGKILGGKKDHHCLTVKKLR